MKKEYWCQSCDESFDIKYQKGLDVKFCPFCGEELTDADFNIVEDED